MGRRKNQNYSVTGANGKSYQYARVTKVCEVWENGVPVKKRITFTGKTITEAEANRDKFIEEQAEKAKPIYEKTFGQVADTWFENYFPNLRIATTTRELYKRSWRHMQNASIYNTYITDITTDTLQQTYNELNVAPITVKQIHTITKQIYQYLAGVGHFNDITKPIILPEIKTKSPSEGIVIWTADELLTIFLSADYSNYYLRALIWLAYLTGMRFSELLGLKYEDLDLNEGLVYVRRQIQSNDGKLVPVDLKTTAAYRTIPVDTDKLIETIDKHITGPAKDLGHEPSDYIFQTKTGKLMDRHNVSTSISRFYKKIGVEAKSFHTYRRTFATQLCHKGIQPEYLKRIMGHSDLNTTMRYYVAVSAEDLKRELERINNLDFKPDFGEKA